MFSINAVKIHDSSGASHMVIPGMVILVIFTIVGLRRFKISSSLIMPSLKVENEVIN